MADPATSLISTVVVRNLFSSENTLFIHLWKKYLFVSLYLCWKYYGFEFEFLLQNYWLPLFQMWRIQSWVCLFVCFYMTIDDHLNVLCPSIKVWVANLEHPRVNTCSLYASPTGLSPYLRFGCLSCRVLYYNLRELYMKVLWSAT